MVWTRIYALPAFVLAFWVLGLATSPPPALAAEDIDALRKEIEDLKRSQEELRRDLDEIKALLEGAAAGTGGGAGRPVEISLANAPALGETDAPVVVMEFTDYQCPFCNRHLQTAFNDIRRDYVESGQVRYILLDFPIDNIHPLAFRASEAALCAKDQDRFWQMHDRLFANQRRLTPEDLRGHAEAIGLDMADFEACMDDNRHAEQIRAVQQLGAQLGISGTPTFLLGVNNPDDPGQVKPTLMIRGAQPYPTFQKAIDQLLRSAHPS